MSYRILKPSVRGASRLTETFCVNSRGIVLNAAVQKAMGLSPDSYVVLFVSDDGYLCLMPGRDGDEGARPLLGMGKGSSKLLAGRDVARHCRRGRYRITGRDGSFYITDCRWEDGQP